MNPLKPNSYQLIPLVKILHNDLNAILIADGVGVGKTISAIYIALYSYFKYKKPIIVFAPAHLLNKWKYELIYKFNIHPLVVNSSPLFNSACIEISRHKYNQKMPFIVLISNSFLRKNIPKLESSCIIFDEIHHHRNSETKSYKSAKKIAQDAKIKVGLSATPINNSYKDLASELSILLSNYSLNSIDYTLQTEWNDLSKFLYALTTSYNKEKLGIHFTNRKISNIHVIYDKNYITNVKELVQKIKPNKSSSFFSLVTYYRLAASNKTAFYKSLNYFPPNKFQDQKINKLNSLIQSKNIKKAIIFCGFKKTASDLAQKLNHTNILTLTGDTDETTREEYILQLKHSKQCLLVMTEVGAEGLDLQFCDTIINYDLHWNPMRLEQRIGRIDRIGQKKKNIKIYNFHVVGSIDDRILETMTKKLNLIPSSFTPKNILGTQKNKPKPQALIYDKDSFQYETNNLDSFLTSLQFTNKFPEKDYEILSNVKKSLCNQNNLRLFASNNKSNLLWNTKSFKTTWIKNINESSNNVKNLINYYS